MRKSIGLRRDCCVASATNNAALARARTTTLAPAIEPANFQFFYRELIREPRFKTQNVRGMRRSAFKIAGIMNYRNVRVKIFLTINCKLFANIDSP